ncbi:MAG: hypothetical protein N2C14_11605, partial [Planctomycetales bacterium]
MSCVLGLLVSWGLAAQRIGVHQSPLGWVLIGWNLAPLLILSLLSFWYCRKSSLSAAILPVTFIVGLLSILSTTKYLAVAFVH